MSASLVGSGAAAPPPTAPDLGRVHRRWGRGRPHRRRGTGGGLARRRALLGAAYAAPTALVVGVLFVAPLLLVTWVSLHRWPLNPRHTAEFRGLGNYTQMADDSLLRGAAVFTAKYTAIIVILLFGLSLGLALLVQHRRPGVGVFRTAFFLPVTVGFASASLLFLGLFSNQIGPVNDALRTTGVIDQPISFTTHSPNVALGTVVVLVLWRFAGFMMLILLTGLQSIPGDLYEAARLDGATSWQAFIRVTLPLLRPTIALVVTLMVAGSMLAFDQFWLLTRGGPDNSTTSLVMVVYREAFARFDLGSAAAISVLLAAVLLVFSTIQIRVLRRRSGEE